MTDKQRAELCELVYEYIEFTSYARRYSRRIESDPVDALMRELAWQGTWHFSSNPRQQRMFKFYHRLQSYGEQRAVCEAAVARVTARLLIAE